MARSNAAIQTLVHGIHPSTSVCSDRPTSSGESSRDGGEAVDDPDVRIAVRCDPDLVRTPWDPRDAPSHSPCLTLSLLSLGRTGSTRSQDMDEVEPDLDSKSVGEHPDSDSFRTRFQLVRAAASRFVSSLAPVERIPHHVQFIRGVGSSERLDTRAGDAEPLSLQ